MSSFPCILETIQLGNEISVLLQNVRDIINICFNLPVILYDLRDTLRCVGYLEKNINDTLNDISNFLRIRAVTCCFEINTKSALKKQPQCCENIQVSEELQTALHKLDHALKQFRDIILLLNRPKVCYLEDSDDEEQLDSIQYVKIKLARALNDIHLFQSYGEGVMKANLCQRHLSKGDDDTLRKRVY